MGVFAPHESRLTGPPTPPNGEFLSYKNRYKGSGNPNGRVSGRLGDTFLDEPTGQEWQKTSGDLLKTGWVPEGDSESLVLATGSTTARENADRWADVKNVLDYLPIGFEALPAHSYIQLAIDEAEDQGGGTVYLPGGYRYLIGVRLEVPDNVRLVGDGESTELFLIAGANCSIITNRDWDKSNSNIYIGFMHLDGNRTNQATETGEGHAFVADGPGQSLIDLVNCRQSGVEFVTGTSSFLHGIDCGVRDEADNSIKTILTSSGIGTMVAGETVTGGTSGATGTVEIVGSDFLAVDAITGTFQTSETLTGGTSSATRVSSSAAQDQGSEDIRVNNCHFRDHGDDGMTTHFSQRIHFHQCSGQESASSYSSGSNGIEFDDGTRNCSASDCYFKDCVAGIQVQGHATRIPARDITITNCNTEDCETGISCVQTTSPHASIPAANVEIIGGSDYGNDRGVLVGNYQSVTISGRTIRNCTTAYSISGLVAGLTRNIKIIGGVLDGTPLILTGANSSRIKVIGLEVKNYTGSAAVTVGVPKVTLSGCDIHNNTAQGIKISSGGVGTIVTGGCTITNNTAEGIELGADGCIISSNHISDNGVGMRVLAGSYNQIRNNRITNNTSYGVRFSNATGGGEMRGNDVNGNLSVVDVIVDSTKGVGWTITQNPGSEVDTGSASSALDVDTILVDDLTAANPISGVIATNLSQPLSGLYFPATAGTKATTSLSTQIWGLVGTHVFRFQVPSANPSANVGLYSFAANSAAHASNDGDFTAFMDVNGSILFRLHNATGSRISSKTNFISDNAGKIVTITVTKTAAGVLAVYLDWKVLTMTENTTDTSPPADWSASFAGLYYHSGIRGSAEMYSGTIYEDSLFNRVLTASEMRRFAQAGVGYSDRWGSQTVLNSGTFTIGKRYRIVARTDGDFTTVGSANNTVGTEFIATATGAGILDAGDTVVAIGAVFHHRYILIGTTQIHDRTVNALHSVAAGGVARIGSDDFRLTVADVEQFKVDQSATATHTRILIWDVDSGLLQRVKVGANATGPGGTGRALYIDNV